MAFDGSKDTVLLRNAEDWRLWLEVTKSTAIAAKIWVYLDPDNEDAPELKEPRMPLPSQIQETALTIADLDANQKEIYRLKLDMYKRELKIFDIRDKAMAEMHAEILKRIPKMNLEYARTLGNCSLN